MALAIMSQGLQSCLDPPLPESSVLTHKSSSSKSKPEAHNNGERVMIKNNNGFSFFNVLENPSSNIAVVEEHDQEVYVHPMVKRSASTLSTMSLEMCTESLGTETGSDVSESSDEFSWEERERFSRLQRSKAMAFHRKTATHRRGGGFPPPLTSISGSDGTVKVRPHREGGRLIIKAVSVSDCGTKFEAERTDGRLRLSLLKDCCVNDETRRANVKNEGGGENSGEEDSCDGDGWWWKRPTRVSTESTEFRLTSCKHGGNGNNWSLFRPMVIS